MNSIPVYDLQNKRIIEEKVYGGDWLKRFYYNRGLRCLINSSWIQKRVSELVGSYKRSPRSRTQIDPFLKQYEMTLEDYEVPPSGFKTFNDFFIRKKKKVSFPGDPAVFPSPCDARLSVSRIEDGVPALKIKGKDVPLPDLLGKFKDQCPQKGWAMTFRLCPLDYHRFHFVDSGVVGETHKLGTQLHSVNPWALQSLPRIFEWNERQLSIQKGEHYGELLYLEVGAMCVGRIHQSFEAGRRVNRGDEKGYFDFGASTLVLIVADGARKLAIHPEILEKNKEGLEVLTRLGDNLAHWE